MVRSLRQHPIRVALSLIALTFLVHLLLSYDKGNVISWDAFGYYFYLPLIFFEHTLILESLEYPKAIFDTYAPSSTLYQFTSLPNGRHIIRYPAGIAVLYSPFFFIGHLAAKLGGYPTDGFSAPYEFAMRVGSFLYHWLAFVCIARLLKPHFKPVTIAITLLLLFFATNAFYYLITSGLAANGTLLFLLPLFLLAIQRYFQKPSLQYALFAGLLLGLMGLSRPTELLAVVPAMLWPALVYNLGFRDTLRRLFAIPIAHLLALASVTALIGVVQLAYWKVAGGDWIINSYGNPAEGLDLHKPYTFSYLFSFKKGWLLYTPFMALVLVYLYWRWLRGDKRLLPAAVYVALFIYVASSWTNWWYGGGWGQRSVIQLYAVLSLPLAALVGSILGSNKAIRTALFWAFTALCITLNFWQSFQYSRGVRLNETETAAYYFASFWDRNYDPTKAHLTALDRFSVVDTEVKTVPPGYSLHQTYPFEGINFPLQLGGQEFFQDFQMPFGSLCPEEHCWIGLETDFAEIPHESLLTVMAMKREEGNYGYRAYAPLLYIQNADSLSGKVQTQSFFLSPHVRSRHDMFQAYLWNRGQDSLLVNGLRIKVYTKD